jgi:hypothetical protein
VVVEVLEIKLVEKVVDLEHQKQQSLELLDMVGLVLEMVQEMKVLQRLQLQEEEMLFRILVLEEEDVEIAILLDIVVLEDLVFL